MKPLFYISVALYAAAVLYAFNTPTFGGPRKTEATLLDAQSAFRSTVGKYQQFKKDEWNPNTVVDEYVTPNGTPGYQVTETEDRVDGKYKRSYGSGPESKSRSYDWILVETIPVATST